MTPRKFDTEGLLEAFEARDTDRILEHFADDVEFSDPVLPEPIRGKETLRLLMEGALPALDEIAVDAERVVQEGSEIAMLLRAKGKYARDAEVPGGGTLNVAGKRFDLPAAVFADLTEAGKIRRVTRVRDNWMVMQQLDLSTEEMERIYRESVPRLAR